MTFFTLLLPISVLLLLAAFWFVLHYYANPVIDNPDGVARIVGNCGDTMEIGLKFLGDKVETTHHWTNGCSVSRQCVEAAAMLARNRTVHELQKINMTTIMDVVGQLPDTHLHCAQLAEITLQRAVRGYVARKKEYRSSSEEKS